MSYSFYIAQSEPEEANKIAWAEQQEMRLAFVDEWKTLPLRWGHRASTNRRDAALLYKLTWGGRL